MTGCGLKIGQRVMGAVIGVACLFIGDGASLTDRSSLVAQANAKTGHPVRLAAVACRTHRRAVVDGVIPLDFGSSAAAGSFYGYAPGTYGGVGCHPGAYGVTVCPP